MNLYELTYVLRSDLDEDTLNAVQERITGRLGDSRGELVKSEAWGRRRLAYPIERVREGLYFTSILRMPGPEVRAYENQLTLVPEILRFLLLRQEEKNINMTGSLLPAVHRPAAAPQPATPEAEGDQTETASEEAGAQETEGPSDAAPSAATGDVQSAQVGEEPEASTAEESPLAEAEPKPVAAGGSEKPRDPEAGQSESEGGNAETESAIVEAEA